jgi:FAD:protein FMN transferase
MPEAKPVARSGATTRRRALRVLAAAAGLPVLIAAVRATAPKGQFYTWRGEVLDAVSELTLWHTNAAFAQRTILRVRDEIERFERIFSLYRQDSEISQLNADGKLMKPSAELRELVEESQRFSKLSDGAFDISVQPLWRLYEAHFWSRTAVQLDIAAGALEVTRALVDFRQIDAGAASIGFARDGMAITLNSLAQGYITDYVADMLRNEGFDSAVVDLGEFRTLGRHPDGRAWRLGIRNGRTSDSLDRTVELENMALAVSGGYGTTFEPSGRFHHIFDPHTGSSANSLVDVAVIGPRATTANGLSTTICVAGEDQAPRLLAAYPGTQAILTTRRDKGDVHREGRSSLSWDVRKPRHEDAGTRETLRLPMATAVSRSRHSRRAADGLRGRKLHEFKRCATVRAVGITQRLSHFKMIVADRLD